MIGFGGMVRANELSDHELQCNRNHTFSWLWMLCMFNLVQPGYIKALQDENGKTEKDVNRAVNHMLL